MTNKVKEKRIGDKEKREILDKYYMYYGNFENLKTLGKEDKKLGFVVEIYRDKLVKLGYDKERLYSVLYVLQEMKKLRLKIEKKVQK